MNSFVAHFIAATLLGKARYFRFVSLSVCCSGHREVAHCSDVTVPRYIHSLNLQDPDGAGDIDIGETRPEVVARMLEDGRRYLARSEPEISRLCAVLGSKKPLSWHLGSL
jgi:hypothetical protein